ncbi:unnamed protein product [Rotaria socialis]|uniref:ABC transmembrane type-1 domain-containing protein n=1 Tax=Rotaria socialis TaxID=392032 RepID=A0A821XB66_9BILA|nr:unnamed protein product [Rotaria socialis]CAF4939897.1 unnamed protein product [Rotaria socialis]
MNRPEWNIILVGCLACLTSGAIQSIGIVLLTKMVLCIRILYICPTKSSSDNDCFAVFIVECCMLVHSSYSSDVVLIKPIIIIILFLLQFTAFAAAGSKLTQRVRSKAFTCLLRQEVAYFDEPENNSGALCARLSSDAMALQEMSGTRLSIIVETFSMLAFGISLGFYFS